jgi:uncharacterized cupin superfamily protein
MRMERPQGATLAVALWELDPGARSGEYHFHHGSEETIIVLRGRPTLRTPDGERELAEGEVVHFARGPEGAHTVVNRSGEPVRYLMAAAHGTPEIIEYPEEGTLCVMARTESQRGGPLFSFHRLDDAVPVDPETR